jgi:Xaa-Pro aminopeptidase
MNFENKFIKNRQNKLEKQMENNSILILFSKENNCKRDESFFNFADRNIFYFTNLESENLRLIFIKENEKFQKYLFVKIQNENEINFSGKTKIKNTNFKKNEIIFYENDNEILKFLEKQNSKKIQKYYFYKDKVNFENTNSYENFIKKSKIKKNQIENSFEIISNLRMIKDKFEISKIKKTIEITKIAFDKIEENFKKNIYENETQILAEIRFIYTNNFGMEGYTSTISNSKNSTILHYCKCNSKINSKNDMILIDSGCELNNYSSDITRCFVKTKRQKQVYESVLKIQKELIKFVKPNLTFREIEIKCLNLMLIELINLNLISKKFEVQPIEKNQILQQKIREFYPHSFGHFLGLDIHDIGNYEIKLKPNMILTIEPGIYIKKENIGIRIEDNILITKNGCENLSENIRK